MIELQWDFFQYDFMRTALAAGLAASVLCGIVGIYVILNKIVFISDGIAHAAFGGIGLGYFLGFDPLAFGIGSAILTALGIGVVSHRARVSEDTAIGVFMATGMALGVMLLTLSRGYARDLYGYLFGNILAVTWNDVLMMLALTLIILVLVFLLYKEFLIMSFDPSLWRGHRPSCAGSSALAPHNGGIQRRRFDQDCGDNHGHSPLDHSWGHKPAAHEGIARHHGRVRILGRHLCDHRPIGILYFGCSLRSDHNSDGCGILLPEHDCRQIDSDRLN